MELEDTGCIDRRQRTRRGAARGVASGVLCAALCTALSVALRAALATGTAASAPVLNNPLSILDILREGGCGGLLPPARALDHRALLDRVAEDWASGRSLGQATEHSGYLAERSAGMHVTGPDASMMQTLRRSSCATVMNAGLRDVGFYRRGSDTWIVVASRYAVPSSAQAPALAARALELVNQARARTTRCGGRSFAPAPPVSLSGTLDGVALGHANDMAQNDYFEHEDLSGHTPADRVRAVGYREKLVGENIAFGPRTAEDVVQGWLDSPGHCENIMDPRFAEMGIAYAAGHGKRGLYWVQVFAAPRA
jgi:uncharacterized protein YkwD